MTSIPDIEKQLMKQYRRTKSPFKAAKAVGISVADAWPIIDKYKDDMFEERHGGLGRPELRPHIVTTRLSSERDWDNDDPAVRRARAQHEAGTHILTTGRDGRTLILYAIPRSGRKDPRPDYFTTENF